MPLYSLTLFRIEQGVRDIMLGMKKYINWRRHGKPFKSFWIISNCAFGACFDYEFVGQKVHPILRKPRGLESYSQLCATFPRGALKTLNIDPSESVFCLNRWITGLFWLRFFRVMNEMMKRLGLRRTWSHEITTSSEVELEIEMRSAYCAICRDYTYGILIDFVFILRK